MMELNRIASHLVAIGTGGMEIGALTVMTIGFREREMILDFFEAVTGLRMNHAYIRPGGVANDLPETGIAQLRDLIELAGEAPARVRGVLQREPDLQGPHVRHRLPGPAAPAWRSASPARCCAPPATTGTCASSSPTAATRPTTSTSITWDTADAYGRFRVRLQEMWESPEDRQAVLPTGWRRPPGQPVMVDDPKIAWPAQLAVGPDGQGNCHEHIKHIMGESMEALIHHFKTRHRGFPGPGRPGLRADRDARRARSACHVVSDGGTKPLPGPHARPGLQPPAVRADPVRGRHDRPTSWWRSAPSTP